MDYVNELRECCLVAYTRIVQGLKGEEKEVIGNDVQLLLPHVLSMITFVSTIARDQEKSDGTIAAAAELIGYSILLFKNLNFARVVKLLINMYFFPKRFVLSFRHQTLAVCRHRAY